MVVTRVQLTNGSRILVRSHICLTLLSKGLPFLRPGRRDAEQVALQA